MKRTIMLAAVAAMGLNVVPAVAAPDPSVNDVIKALTITPGAGRGSRPVAAPPAGQAPAAASRPAAAPATSEGSGALDLSVQFASGTSDLTPAARKTLDVLGQALKSAELANARMRIEGHTDTTGTREANSALSWRRANAAVAYLQEKWGIPASRLEAVGKGQDELAVATGPGVDEPRNRRVHVVNLTQ